VTSVASAAIPGGLARPDLSGHRLSGQRPRECRLLLDHDQRRVWADGQEVPLTYQDFELLASVAHPATVFSGPALVAQVWHPTSPPTAERSTSREQAPAKAGPAYGRYLVTEYAVAISSPVVT